MAYSGTVGQTVITTQQMIDQGARLSGKLAEELTVEQVQGSKQALFFVLSNLINQGINYWAINKQVYGLNPDQYEYKLPLGGVDVLNVLYRQINAHELTQIPGGSERFRTGFAGKRLELLPGGKGDAGFRKEITAPLVIGPLRDGPLGLHGHGRARVPLGRLRLAWRGCRRLGCWRGRWVSIRT